MTPSAIATNDSTIGADAAEPAVPRSIARLLDLFETVLLERTCNLATAANASHLMPTTALRYLCGLEARGYLDRDEAGDFSARPTILRIAASLRGASVLDRLGTIAQPHLDALAQRTGESAYLAVSDGQTGSYIAAAPSARAIRHIGWVGQDIALEASALGAALVDPGTVVTRTGAVEPDVTAMSMALLPNKKLGIAISIIGPHHRFTNDQQAAHKIAIRDCVDALHRALSAHREDFMS